MIFFFRAGPLSEEAELIFVREVQSKQIYDYLFDNMSDGHNEYANILSKKILDGLFTGGVNLSCMYESFYKKEYKSIIDFLQDEMLLDEIVCKKIENGLSKGIFSIFKIRLYETMGYHLSQLVIGEFNDDYSILEEINKKMRKYYENCE